jgi:C-terminal processing protease CtpA/Prc
VIVIVNEHSQSQAEYTTLAFQASPNVTVIGSTTAGADGNVSAIMLPGGLSTMISGINVLYPDGTETQRKGVKIDHVIHPTIAGIKAGRDELLEKAVALINGQ